MQSSLSLASRSVLQHGLTAAYIANGGLPQLPSKVMQRGSMPL
jgi:hypothetical protein